MKFEHCDGQSNHSDFSSDSQDSQGSSADFRSALTAARSALSLASLDGLNSGVPTRTTATLTPTHLRNIQQTFIELQCRTEQASHAGFVPPPVTTHANNDYGMLNTTAYHDIGPGAPYVSPGPLSSEDSSSSPGLPLPKRRNMGGRRPNKVDENLTPEEEERRRVRRERNKQAAARCRKRRLDQTNELQEETDKLEKTKQNLQEELRQLNQSREHLEFILNNHILGCRLPKRVPSPPDVKPFQAIEPQFVMPMTEDVRVKVEIVDPDPVLGLDNDIFDSPVTEKRIMLSSANPQVLTSCHQTTASNGSLDTPPIMPKRPNSLQVPFNPSPAQVHNIKNGAELAGIDITTPSTGISFNFDSLMDGGTGLTPVALHPCSTQQQKSHIEIISPESANPRLVNL